MLIIKGLLVWEVIVTFLYSIFQYLKCFRYSKLSILCRVSNLKLQSLLGEKYVFLISNFNCSTTVYLAWQFAKLIEKVRSFN